MALDSYLYLDPELVLIRKQEIAAAQLRNCGQCIHRRTMQVNGEELNGCAMRRDYGRRCQAYSVESTTKRKGRND